MIGKMEMGVCVCVCVCSEMEKTKNTGRASKVKATATNSVRFRYLHHNAMLEVLSSLLFSLSSPFPPSYHLSKLRDICP